MPAPAPTPAPAPAAQKITIGFAHIWPATSAQQVDQFTRYFKRVEKAAGGKYTLDVQYYPVGTLLGGADIYDGVIKGIAEAGCTSFGYTPGRFPVTLTMNQPGIAPPANCSAAGSAMWEFYHKYQPAELANAKTLYIFATGPGWLHSRKAIRTVDDLKGLKIRVTGAGVNGVKAVGGEAVAMAQGDVYLSAQKGIVDASVSPVEVLQTYKQGEVFPYSTFMPFFYSEFFPVTVNWGKWSSLPKDLQDAFDNVELDGIKEAGQIWEYINKTAWDYSIALPGGHEFIYFSDTEVAKMKELLKPIRNTYVADLKAKGFPGEDIANSAATIVEKYNKQQYEPWKP
jgi:TRAP-type C4-dicarboxylate transport system substrate-binding protein